MKKTDAPKDINANDIRDIFASGPTPKNEIELYSMVMLINDLHRRVRLLEDQVTLLSAEDEQQYDRRSEEL